MWIFIYSPTLLDFISPSFCRADIFSFQTLADLVCNPPSPGPRRFGERAHQWRGPHRRPFLRFVPLPPSSRPLKRRFSNRRFSSVHKLKSQSSQIQFEFSPLPEELEYSIYALWNTVILHRIDVKVRPLIFKNGRVTSNIFFHDWMYFDVPLFLSVGLHHRNLSCSIWLLCGINLMYRIKLNIS